MEYKNLSERIRSREPSTAGEPLKITAYRADDDVVSPATPRPKVPVTVHRTVFRAQASGQSYARQALGLRYNLDQRAALKFELLNSSFKAESGRAAVGYRSLFIQYAIGF